MIKLKPTCLHGGFCYKSYCISALKVIKSFLVGTARILAMIVSIRAISFESPRSIKSTPTIARLSKFISL